MNDGQLCRQLQYLLTKKTWTPASSEAVFGSVLVSAGTTEDMGQTLRTPFVLICPLEDEGDRQAPGLRTQRIEVTLAVQNAGDALGQNTLIGGNQTGQGTSGQGSSIGQGLLRVQSKLLEVVKFLDQTSGLRLVVVSRSAIKAAYEPGSGYAAWRSYILEARCSTTETYDAPLAFRGFVNTSSVVKLSWTNNPLRFDYDYQTSDNNQVVPLGASLVLKRIAGSVAPLFPHESGGPTGTIVHTWTGSSDFAALPTSYDDSPGSGTWSYALAAGFDETGSAAVERWSDVPATVLSMAVP